MCALLHGNGNKRNSTYVVVGMLQIIMCILYGNLVCFYQPNELCTSPYLFCLFSVV